ncbi:hypothetical protein F5884DRAFT_804184 [Xylogone sp. PMI_703]|nr:hypothetical protein F5884DRAFT_804184 [Xylogone sp. PMI_703]
MIPKTYRGAKDDFELSVSEWKKDKRIWRSNDLSHNKFHTHIIQESSHLVSADSDVGIILANADKIRQCDGCKQYFSNTFQIPAKWWSSHYRRSNGYFGCRTIRDEKDEITAITTWMRFLVKQLTSEVEHEWYKINIFTLWVPATEQPNTKGETTIIVFDAPHPIRPKIPSPLLNIPDPAHLNDPFWMYPSLAEELVNLQDEAVWKIRNHVRAMEKAVQPEGKPRPDYRRLHDIARHAIHVSETLDLSVKSMNSILIQHADVIKDVPPQDKRVSKDIRQQLLTSEHMLESLRYRATSNKERLLNEIQLTFNNVAQYDTETLVTISSAAQLEGKSMKTVAFITLVFLPSTFVSAIFSMSFFNYDGSLDIWHMSDKFWIYWLVAGFATMVTFIAYYWNSISPFRFVRKRISARHEKLRELSLIKQELS